MTRLEPITDLAGDDILARERRERDLEKASHPSIWLGALNPCAECGCVPKEIAPGHWACACCLPIGVN